MDNRDKQIRVGRIDYTNVWPIFYYFPTKAFEGAIELVPQVPSSLNKAMAAGDIAMGPISSFSYGEHFDDYVLYPDLSVSALQSVKSIMLFHRKPLNELDGASIALTTASATSVNLLKIILDKGYGLKPNYTSAAPSLTDMMQEHDAALLIGDDAIKATWVDYGYLVTDLGEEWFKLTGKWMTFAVWAIRKQVLDSDPEMIGRIYEAFLESKRKSLKDPAGLIADARTKIGGTEHYWEQYFGNLCYDFGPNQWAGLQLFYDYSYELGLLPRKVQLKIWQHNSVVQVTG